MLWDHTGRIQPAKPGESWLVATNSQGRFFFPSLTQSCFLLVPFGTRGLFLFAPCTEGTACLGLYFMWEYQISSPLHPNPTPQASTLSSRQCQSSRSLISEECLLEALLCCPWPLENPSFHPSPVKHLNRRSYIFNPAFYLFRSAVLFI